MAPETRLERIRKRLESLMPASQIDAFLAAIMSDAGIDRIESANDQLRIAEALTRRPGVYRVLGRALKIDALLGGATEAAS